VPRIAATARRVLVALALAAPVTPAQAASCGSAPVSKDQLNASDVVVTGVVTVVKERWHGRRHRPQVKRGIAEIRAEDVQRNRTRLTSPFRFTFEYVFDGECAWGVTVYDGELAILHLVRSPLRGRVLKAIDVDYP
jgi:hypothetical protein